MDCSDNLMNVYARLGFLLFVNSSTIFMLSLIDLMMWLSVDSVKYLVGEVFVSLDRRCVIHIHNALIKEMRAMNSVMERFNVSTLIKNMLIDYADATPPSIHAKPT
ncbi:uncharacterized protein LOC144748837 [Ciona intestinalis]